MGWILLTNDDGVDSPALVPFARALAGLGEVRVVVPDRERSWVAKAITRHDPIRVDEVERDGVPMWAASGYPADAVQLGIHALFEEPPALVVSGINLGYNHGAGFLMSSGTVGATTEAWVSGVQGIAVSTGTVHDWAAWREMIWDPGSAPGWTRTAELAARVVGDLVEDRIGEHCDVVTVNLPFDPAGPPERRITRLARVGYDRLFRARGDGVYVHDFGGGFRHFESLEGTDVDAAHHDLVSITPIRMPEAASIPPELAARVTSRR